MCSASLMEAGHLFCRGWREKGRGVLNVNLYGAGGWRGSTLHIGRGLPGRWAGVRGIETKKGVRQYDMLGWGGGWLDGGDVVLIENVLDLWLR